MNIEQAKQYIIDHGRELLQPDNSSRNKSPNAKNYGYICPICGSGSGKNGTGITSPDGGRHFTCWAGCFQHSSIFDIFIKRDGYEGRPYIEQLRYMCDLLHITLDPIESTHRTTAVENFRDVYPVKNESLPAGDTAFSLQGQEPENYMDQFLEWKENLSSCNYLTNRGISPETQARFLCGYCENWRHPKAPQGVPASPRVIIPTSPFGYIARDTRTDLNEVQKKYSKQKAGAIHLFNADVLNEGMAATVFIVEGEIDAMSIEELGFRAIGLGSVNNCGKLIQELKKRYFMLNGLTETQTARQIDEIETQHDRLKLDFKSTFPRLVIALDNDLAGQTTARDLSTQLEDLGVNYTNVTSKNIYDGAKDANEALLKDRNALKKRLEHYTKNAAELYNEQSAAYLLDEFQASLEYNTNPKPISTGFFNLDECLDGGLFEGLYTIGAISSLGKTTFALQIADNIARQGHDVLIFSLEMSKRELLAKSISRLTLANLDDFSPEGLKTKARSVRDLTTYSNRNNAEQHQIIQTAIKDYSTFASNIFILEGLGDIDVTRIQAQVSDHIKLRGKTPVIVVDYLQIVAPYDTHATDKQNTDKAVLELKRLSRDSKTPVIIISSLNRQNYNEAISMQAFKESGAIEYSSDVLIGLQLAGAGGKAFDVDEAKRQNPRKIEAKILKNRNGRTGDIIQFDFFSMYNCFDPFEK